MFKKYLFVATFIFIAIFSICQTPKIDSLVLLDKRFPQNDSNKVNRYADIAYSLGSLNPVKGLTYSQQALHIADSLKYDNGKLNALYSSGVCYFRTGHVDSALNCFSRSLALAEKQKNLTLIGKNLNGIGGVNFAVQHLDSALNYFLRSITIFKQLGDTARLSTSLNNIGNIHGLQLRKKEALEFYGEALRLGLLINDYQVVSLAAANIADTWSRLNQQDSAYKYAKLAIGYAEAIKDYHNLALAKGTLGLSEYRRNNFDSALPYLHQSLLLFQQMNNKNYVAQIDVALGKIYIKKNLYDSALVYFKEANVLAGEMESKDRLRLSCEGLSDIYAAKKNYEPAYQYLHQYLELQNEFIDSLNISTVESLNAKYKAAERQSNIDRLEKEKAIRNIELTKQTYFKNSLLIGLAIVLIFLYLLYKRYKQRIALSNQLSQSLTELKSTQAQLIKIEKQKEAENIRVRISRDIHDEIGSNLTKISFLSSISAHHNQHGSQELNDHLKQIQEYSHDVNTSLGEIVWAISPKYDTLESLIAYMQKHIHSFFENTGLTYQINFPTTFENTPLNPELKRNIFLVLKESLNNTLKYAKASAVDINLEIVDDSFTLRIKDNGVGFNYNINDASHGNGIVNMNSRMQQSGGHLKIISSNGNGTEIIASGKLS